MGYGIGSKPGGSSGGLSSGSNLAYKPEKIGGTGGGGSKPASQPDTEAGKLSIDMTDPIGSVGDIAGSIGQFGANLAGGVLGAIGSLGPDGETASIGQLAEDLGRIPGGVGDFQLPYLGNDPNARPATLSQVPGAMFEPIYQAQQALGREGARNRVTGVGYQGPDIRSRDAAGNIVSSRLNSEPLPPDLQQRLDAGESTDVIAEELLNRGQAYSTNPVKQLANEALFDPLNLLAPGVGKAAAAAKEAGIAVRAADDLAKLGLGQRSIGTIYNVATHGMTKGGAALMDKVVGPTTSGVFHALGTAPYKALVSGAGKLDSAYGERFSRAFDLGAGQLPRAVIAREIAADVASKIDSVARHASPAAISRAVETRLATKGGGKFAKELERRSEELLARVAPEFYGLSRKALRTETTAKYAAITGMSVEDAARVLGKSAADKATARTVHLAYYGHAGGELADIKNVLRGQAKLGIDVDRLTVLAPDTLTDELAAKIGTEIGVADAVERFSVLNNHFLGKNPSDTEVLEFIEKLQKGDALPQAVKLPKKGKLPPELSDWRVRNSEFGYELGFAPKDGWKSIVDADGNVVVSDPFVHFVSDVEPTSMRNPLGQFVDTIMRGKTQTIIVQESRQRMVDAVAKAKLPVSPNQVRSIHKAIIEAAADAKMTPRGLVGMHTEGGTIYEAIFKRFLSPAEYEKVTAQFDPTYLVMHAFEGNLKTVGLTQKVTGRIKTHVPIMAKIAEDLYPKARFTYRPTFQAQEIIESPSFNGLRGVTDREVADDLVAAYRQLAEQPEFKFLTEANFLNIAGDRAMTRFMGRNTPIGRALGRFTNIQARKEVARVRQVMFEHGEDFKNAVTDMNPKYWKAMEDAYGTTDPKVIADRFLAERMTLAGGNEKAVMGLIDDVTAHSDLLKTLEGDVIRVGDEAASQAANVRVAAARGGTAGSGGALLDEGAFGSSSASDAVLQAFKDSFRQASNRAFQTHFFNPQRGWLERSLNHPYLGLYPLSYMWGKVLPEFARFLVVRPFGKNVPLLPLVNLERVQQAYLGALADDPAFSKYMADHEEAIYFANLLFPGNPLNMNANAPAYLRHITADAAAGRKVDSTTISREIADSTSYAFGPAHDLTTVNKAGADLVGIGQDIFESLTKSAEQYDNMFPRITGGTPLVQK